MEKKPRKTTSATQLQEFEKIISTVPSQQCNDSDSSCVDIDEVGDDDDVTGQADRNASSEQLPTNIVESSDHVFLTKIAALEHKVHFLEKFWRDSP